MGMNDLCHDIGNDDGKTAFFTDLVFHGWTSISLGAVSILGYKGSMTRVTN